MADQLPPPIAPRNPATHRSHQRQVFAQILLPMLTALAGAVILAILSTTSVAGSAPQTALWAHISTIFMAVLAISAGLGVLIVLIAMIFGTGWVLNKLPGYSYIGQLYAQIIQIRVKQIADLSSLPVIQLKTGWKALSAFSTAIRKQLGGK
jgi:hypothetical protein